MWGMELDVGIARRRGFDNLNSANNGKGTVHEVMHAVSHSIEIKNDCVSKDIRGVTPGLLYSESTVYRVYHLTLCQNHLMTLSIPEMDGHVSMLGGFLTLYLFQCTLVLMKEK